jgi:hypothetical protein
MIKCIIQLAKMLSNIHMMLLSITFFAKPMFRVNKPLFILEQTMDVTWKNIHNLLDNILPCHRIFRDMEKYSAMSLNNIHVADEYTKNIP